MLKTIPVGEELLFRAIDIAAEYNLSVYDGIYIATARFLKSKWLTADLKATKKVPSDLTVTLKDFA